MAEKFWQRVRDGWKKSESPGVKGPKSTWFLLALLVLGIVLMFISANPDRGAQPAPPVESKEALANLGGKSDYKERLEKELASHLRRVRGVGDVTVMVTLESGPVFEYGENRETTDRTTQEEDGGGGKRAIDEQTVRTQLVFTRDGAGEQPLITREMQPRLRGVMVIAGGADDPVIRERVASALQAILGLPAHRVTVLPMK